MEFPAYAIKCQGVWRRGPLTCWRDVEGERSQLILAARKNMAGDGVCHLLTHQMQLINSGFTDGKTQTVIEKRATANNADIVLHQNSLRKLGTGSHLKPGRYLMMMIWA